MEKIEVKIKSKVIVKPFSETPNHLKSLQFSLIDQFTPPAHTPYIFFYHNNSNNNNNNSQTSSSELLKNSLSETLVEFYPLAGRIEGNLSINCNDEGVEYYEANVLANVAEIIANPDPEELIRLLPFAPVSSNKSIVTAVQVNHFSCGGIAISVCISHKIADATTSVAFINAWALNARASGGVFNIDHTTKSVTLFDSASFFPPMDLNGKYDPESVISKEKIVTTRLIFDKEKLDELKRKCNDNGGLEIPATRVSVVSAFISTMLIKMAKAKPTPIKIFSASLIVNLRTIKNSPIPENYCGNLFGTAVAHTHVEPEIEYTELAGKLSMSVKQFDTSYLPKIKTGEYFWKLPKVYDKINQGEAETCAFSSWVRLPVYEVNFGWGKPIWVSTTGVPYKNSVVLLPTKCGHGIEAWLNLLQHDVAMLEQDHGFRSLASHIIQP